jgi:hypothetical protein
VFLTCSYHSTSPVLQPSFLQTMYDEQSALLRSSPTLCERGLGVGCAWANQGKVRSGLHRTQDAINSIKSLGEGNLLSRTPQRNPDPQLLHSRDMYYCCFALDFILDMDPGSVLDAAYDVLMTPSGFTTGRKAWRQRTAGRVSWRSGLQAERRRRGSGRQQRQQRQPGTPRISVSSLSGSFPPAAPLAARR